MGNNNHTPKETNMGMFSVNGGGEGLTPRPEPRQEVSPNKPVLGYETIPGMEERIRRIGADMLARARPIPGLDRPTK
jgi:hypothetical protein